MGSPTRLRHHALINLAARTLATSVDIGYQRTTEGYTGGSVQTSTELMAMPDIKGSPTLPRDAAVGIRLILRVKGPLLLANAHMASSGAAWVKAVATPVVMCLVRLDLVLILPVAVCRTPLGGRIAGRGSSLSRRLTVALLRNPMMKNAAAATPNPWNPAASVGAVMMSLGVHTGKAQMASGRAIWLTTRSAAGIWA